MIMHKLSRWQIFRLCRVPAWLNRRFPVRVRGHAAPRPDPMSPSDLRLAVRAYLKRQAEL